MEALDLGADDYLTKPFGVDELLPAFVRCCAAADPWLEKPPSRIYRSGEVEIDLVRLSVRRSGREVKLTKTEWGLLETLSAHPGRLMTHGWLLEKVWGRGYESDIDVLRVFVSQLRKKIEPDPERPSLILTDPGIGYRWTLNPVEPAP